MNLTADASFEPLTVVRLQHAVLLVLSEKAVVVHAGVDLSGASG